jgi:uncharacterized protein (TIGR00156 family)
MLKHRLPLALLTAMCVTPLHAQYVGPGTARAPTSLTELLQQPVDGQSVQLRGRLLQQLNHDKFLFSDGRSQIRVQIKKAVFPAQPVDDKTELQISGTIEKDFMETPEIDVDSVELVNGPMRGGSPR